MTRLWFEAALLPGGWAHCVRLTLTDGLISRVETGTDADVRDECHGTALPGLANVHSHGFQRAMAGLAEYRGASDDDFWSWRSLMYRFLDRLDPDDVEAICAMAYVEMLESGYTRVGEFHYLHGAPDGSAYANPAEMAGRVMAAAASSGIGLTLLPVFYAHGDFGGTAPTPGQRRFVTDLDGFAKLLEMCEAHCAPDMIVGVAPHSLRAVTPAELAVLATMRPHAPIHIHAAEQAKEVDASLAFSGERPVEWLLNHAGIDARWTLIHATHLTNDETRRLATSGAVVGLCPLTEANLGDGIFPAVEYLESGGSIATGSDSNILIDPAQELRALEYSQRLRHERRNRLASPAQPSVARRLFDATLAGGGQALGVAAGLSAGAPADIITLAPDHPALYGRTGDALLDSWVFAARGNGIDGVWRAGRKQVSGGHHHRAASVQQRYFRTLDKILGA